MRAVLAMMMAATIATGCDAAHRPKDGQPETGAPSISAELVLTTLAASAAEPLTREQLCDRAGICGADGQADIEELTRKGLVTSRSSGSFQLTPAGAKYINDNFVITRNGDEVSFEKRGGQH